MNPSSRRPATLLNQLAAGASANGIEPNADAVYVGIIGLHQMPTFSWNFADSLSFHHLSATSDANEILRAISNPQDAAILSRYARYVQHELEVTSEIASKELAIDFAYSFLKLLRAKTRCEIIVPGGINASWTSSSLNTVRRQSCESWLLEDVPNTLAVNSTTTVTDQDLDWVAQNIQAFLALYSSRPSFALAADSIAQHNHQGSLRMASAMLWSGLEALFDVRGELTYRIAAYIAAILESRGDARIALFRKVKEQYNVRSRVVHGDSVKDELVIAHISETRAILGRVICAIVERQSVPTTEQLDRLVLA